MTTLHLDQSRKPEWLPPLRAQPSPRRRPTDGMNPLEKRAWQIQQRIEALEAARRVLGPCEKWPTVTSVRFFRKKEAKSFPLNDDIPLETGAASENPPRRSANWPSSIRRFSLPPSKAYGASLYSPSAPLSSRQLLAHPTPHRRHSAQIEPLQNAPKIPLAPFPISITRHRPLTSFHSFTSLPPELRLQIWQTALESPKFMEVQFCTESFEPTFVNWGRSSALFYVCRESREVAISARSADITHRQKFPHDLSSMPQNLSMMQDYRWPHPHATIDRPLGMPLTTQEKRSRWPNGFIHFVPSRDTIFLRTLDNANFSLGTSGWRMKGVELIQHLAVPLDTKKGLPSRTEWGNMLLELRALKTITFLIGCEEKSWKGERPIELRDMEQWFVDGRYRLVRNGRERMDIADVPAYLMGKDFSRRPPGPEARHGTAPKIVNVRVVAWKRGR